VPYGETTDPLSKALEAPLLTSACVADGSTESEPEVELWMMIRPSTAPMITANLTMPTTISKHRGPSDFAPNALVAMKTAISPKINLTALPIPSKKIALGYTSIVLPLETFPMKDIAITVSYGLLGKQPQI
jgi:hypothetical protein